MAATRRPKRVMSAAQQAEARRKEQVVLEHRTRGWSWARIRDEFEISHPDRVFQRAIRRPENEGYLRAEAIRLEEIRLDALQEGIWDKAVGGDARAVEVCLKVLERRARMGGLDFADLISGQLVEVEQAKVAAMGAAVLVALEGLPDAAERSAAFFAALRAAPTPAALSPADREWMLDDDEDPNLTDDDLALL